MVSGGEHDREPDREITFGRRWRGPRHWRRRRRRRVVPPWMGGEGDGRLSRLGYERLRGGTVAVQTADLIPCAIVGIAARALTIAPRTLAAGHICLVTCAGSCRWRCPKLRVSGVKDSADSPSEGVGVTAAEQQVKVGGGERIQLIRCGCARCGLCPVAVRSRWRGARGRPARIRLIRCGSAHCSLCPVAARSRRRGARGRPARRRIVWAPRRRRPARRRRQRC